MLTKARSPWFLAVVSLALLVSVPAGAQPFAGRDIVRLRNGGILRGNIAEVVPGRGVVIVLLTGETRRVPASEIVFAGPESGPVAPPVRPPAPPPVQPSWPMPPSSPSASPRGFVPQAAPGAPGVAPALFRGAGFAAPVRPPAAPAPAPTPQARSSGAPALQPAYATTPPPNVNVAPTLPPIARPAPPAPPRAFEQQAPTVSVRFEAEEPGTTLHRVTGSSVASATVFVGGRVGYGVSMANSYERVCTAPCTFAAPLGTHELALSVPGRLPLPADAVTFEHGGVLRGEYNSRRGIRAVGWTIFTVGIVGSLALLGAAAQVAEDDGGITESSRGKAMAYGSLGALVGAPLLSLPFILQRDSAELETR